LKPEVKVILLSAFEIDPQTFSKGLPLIKIDRFVSKPVSTRKMIEVVKTHTPKPLKAYGR
jgi:response regulator RpfG family c-di-GMP phosphodiesterase